MKFGAVLIWCCLFSLCIFGQEYRISYDAAQLPELYDRVDVFAEEKRGNSFVKLNNNSYKLKASSGELRGKTLIFDKKEIYKNGGTVRFVLLVDRKEYRATLQLPILTDIRFNLYTDSVKPVLNYWVNIEGVFSNGKTYPLDTSFIALTCDNGSMKGMEWILPGQRGFDKVTFTAISKFDPLLKKEKTLYIKKYKDPRDDAGYEEKSEENIINNRRRK